MAVLGALIQAEPLESNLFEWHCNLWGHGANASPLHLILKFSEDYPISPPKVFCCTPFPHSNVQRTKDGWTICLDMLEKPKGKPLPYAGWSSAMSVMSVLLQLQSFITDTKLHYAHSDATAITRTRANALMSEFTCVVAGCSHSGEEPWPPRQSECIPRAAVEKRIVCLPCGSIALSGPIDRSLSGGDKFNDCFPLPKPDMPEKSSVKSAPVPAVITSNPFACLDVADELPALSTATAMPPAKGTHTPTEAAPMPAPITIAEPATTSTSKAGPLQSKLTDLISAPCTPWNGITKAQKKNMQRDQRRLMARMARTSGSSDQASVSSSTSDKENMGADKLDTHCQPDPAACQPDPATLALVLDNDTLPVIRDDSHLTPPDVLLCASAGVFSILGYDAFIILLEHFAERDVRALACTCKGLSSLAEDGLLWRTLFAQHYPASALSAASMSEWKHCFMLELSSNASQLQCFHTKQIYGVESDRRAGLEIFGIPLSFTVNPRTQEVDYIYSSMDLLSYSAYADGGVRRTVWNEPFTHFLPLYLDAQHFQTALPILKRTLLALTGNAPSWRHARGKFLPEMALDVLPKLICTMAVLLSDRGVASSDRLLDGYCQLHRLLHAFTDVFPQLRSSTSTRVQRFIKNDGARSKQSEPSLGVIIPLLAIASGLRWSELAWPLLEESMDRGVLWVCREHPELARPKDVCEADLIEWSWQGRAVANRLLMFHVGFLRRLSKVSNAELDRFHGQCTPWLRGELRTHVATVFAVNDWPGFFSCINVPLPSKAYFAEWLRRSVLNSERKRYHKRGMDFSRVHRSGVSAILRKGESTSCSPTMKRVLIEEVWRWNDHTIYLDASCLTYGFDGAALATVDFSKTVSVTGVTNGASHGVYGRHGQVALRHSGDVISDKEGSHTISISLNSLSDHVESCYITLSGWTTTLSGIIRPEVRCHDPDDKSSEPLARYELEGRSTGRHTAVVMARIWRKSPKARWQVTAIGELCMGRASCYDPIHAKIRQLRGDEVAASDAESHVSGS